MTTTEHKNKILAKMHKAITKCKCDYMQKIHDSFFHKSKNYKGFDNSYDSEHYQRETLETQRDRNTESLLRDMDFKIQEIKEKYKERVRAVMLNRKGNSYVDKNYVTVYNSSDELFAKFDFEGWLNFRLALLNDVYPKDMQPFSILNKHGGKSELDEYGIVVKGSPTPQPFSWHNKKYLHIIKKTASKRIKDVNNKS